MRQVCPMLHPDLMHVGIVCVGTEKCRHNILMSLLSPQELLAKKEKLQTAIREETMLIESYKVGEHPIMYTCKSIIFFSFRSDCRNSEQDYTNQPSLMKSFL